MPLTLVTGPANSEKARIVLERYEALYKQRPLLVVPTAIDVGIYRQELVQRGHVFGVHVLQFSQLFDLIAKRFQQPRVVMSAFMRQTVIEGLLQEEYASERQQFGPRFAKALAQMFDELATNAVDAQDFLQAIELLAKGSKNLLIRLAKLWQAYCELLHKHQLYDRQLKDRQLVASVARNPQLWQKTPVCIYGFDDLTGVQCDLIEVLANRAQSDVILALPYERGRFAFAGRATTFELLRPSVSEHVDLPAQPQHYASGARETLHNLERHLFEEDTPLPMPAANGVVRLIEAGTLWDEARAVTSWVKQQLAAGIAYSEIAIVVRDRAELRAALTTSFHQAGIPVAGLQRRPLQATSLGQNFLAFLKAANPQAAANELIAWLRNVNIIHKQTIVDRFEADIRRRGLADMQSALPYWEEKHWSLDALHALRAASGGEIIQLLAEQLHRLTGGKSGKERSLSDEDTAVLETLHQALTELFELTRLGQNFTLQTILRLFVGLQVELPVGASEEALMFVDPLWLRARRVRSLAVVGFIEGVFPALHGSEGILTPNLRALLAQETAVKLGGQEDRLGSERYLFYALSSRATDSLLLSWHTTGVNGATHNRSIFVDDVLECLDIPVETVHMRDDFLQETSTHNALQGAEILAGRKTRWSASELEVLLACPTRWWIERDLHLRDLEVEPEPLQRGSFAHRVLEATFRELAPLSPTGCDNADFWLQVEAVLAKQLAQQELRFADSERAIIARRQLESDLLRVLKQTLICTTGFVPTHFELAFGREGDKYPPLVLADGTELVGVIDRIDVGPCGTAIIYDYKQRRVVEHARWQRENILQMPLYMFAVNKLLGLDVRGGFYQPVSGSDLRPRGVIANDVELGRSIVQTDCVTPEQLTVLIKDAQTRACTAIARLRKEGLGSYPETCSAVRGCCYPGVCR